MSYQLERARLNEATTNKLRLLEEDFHCRVVALQAKVQYAELSRDQFAKIQHMERELAVSLVAYQATDYYRFASLPAQTLQRVQQLEKDTGVVFVAYQHIHEDATGENFHPEDGFEVADLSEDQAERLQRSERETNLLLMAYRKSKNK
jgi:hypothetical protein